MKETTTLNLKVDPLVKEQAEKVFSQLGMPLSTAVNLFLNQVRLTGKLPFEVALPKAPPSVNAEVMSGEELLQKLRRSLEKVEAGNCKPAAEVFSSFMESHGYEAL